jgi:hypothetical protein
MLKGRGALSNPPGRFDRTQSQSVDDGWYQDELPSSLATSVEADRARSVITTNDSPDVGFEQSINPYRGCEHGCVYCAWGGTPILMADGGARPLEALRAGDAIYGTGREGWYRRYTKTQVIAHWSVIKPAYRVRLENGTELVTGGDHRLLTERGWKFVTGAERGVGCRPHLTTGNKLMGTGEFASAVPQDQDYRRGYLCGVIRGDGMLRQGVSCPADGSGRWSAVNQFRLALCDVEALDRAQGWLQSESIATKRFAVSASSMRP